MAAGVGDAENSVLFDRVYTKRDKLECALDAEDAFTPLAPELLRIARELWAEGSDRLDDANRLYAGETCKLPGLEQLNSRDRAAVNHRARIEAASQALEAEKSFDRALAIARGDLDPVETVEHVRDRRNRASIDGSIKSVVQRLRLTATAVTAATTYHGPGACARTSRARSRRQRRPRARAPDPSRPRRRFTASRPSRRQA